MNGKSYDSTADTRQHIERDGAMNGKSYDSTADTRQHIERVQSLLFQMIGNLHTRRREHDMSKFMSPEKEVFDRETPNLKSLEYGSDEYKQALEGWGA